MAKQTFLLMLSVLLVISFWSSTFAKEYKAAAFEHQPYFETHIKPPSRAEALVIMRRNTAVYSEQAREAFKQGAQIIVFPEDGIYGIDHRRDTIKPYLEPIPEVSNVSSINPCIDPQPNTDILNELSCIAKNNSIALVANMGDIQHCSKSDPNCPKDGRYQYNTDVVFDRNGRLLAKYHKQHLYFEKAFNTPTKCEFVTFVTSFQVRFGVFTCFDMLFKDPAIDLVQTYGIQNIVFPTAWFHGFPMIISIEFQQAWSRVNCVNLIAADLYIPEAEFSTGSGIYDCGEPKIYLFNQKLIEKRLLVATLNGNRNALNGIRGRQAKLYRRDNTASDLDDTFTTRNIEKFQMKQYKNVDTFKGNVAGNMFTMSKLVSSESEISLCGEHLCCHLNYGLPKGKEFTESFALGAFLGENRNGFYWEVCLLLKCFSSEESSCGRAVMDSETVFESFTMTGNFSSNALVFPTAMGNGFSLLSTNEIKFQENSISGDALEQPLLTAALVGRVFSKDKPQD
ncbi:pantetheinase-like [Dendronephthya gigantea]|uniref:pantetheinase-like n=1 Tax=Dendronephthya gigantea TaxID=151771 RepID=UPI00106C18BF|nr:pantetheinase-like [Dendronephthya gigantea]